MNTQIIPYEEKIYLFEDQAKTVQVMDQTSLTRASDLILAGKDLEKTIKDYFGPLKQNAHTAWKSICDRENLELSRVRPITEKLNRAVADYRFEQERKRREAEEATRRVEAEKKRLEEETLRKAQEAEMRAKAAKNEEARKKAQAEADAILARAAEEETKIAPVPIIPEAPRTEGLSMRTTWKARVTSLPDLIQEVAHGRVSVEALLPNMSFLDGEAREVKGPSKITGVDFYPVHTMAESKARTSFRGESEKRI